MTSTEPSTPSALPDGVTEPTRNLHRQSAHFRHFVERQEQNCREFFYDDTKQQYLIEAVDELVAAARHAAAGTSSAAGNSQNEEAEPLVIRLAGKHTHLLFRHPHPRWYDLAANDFLRRKSKLSGATIADANTPEATAAGAPVPVTELSVYNPQRNPRVVKALLITAVFAVSIFMLWPIWDFMVAVKANEHLQTLGLAPGATQSEIKKKYRELARKMHPDRNVGCGQRCTDRWMEVVKAYEVLAGRDDASELQVQIDQMMGQIVMFVFGDVFEIVIQAGILFSGFLHRAVFGSLSSSLASSSSSVLKTAVRYVDWGVRLALLLCGIGLVVYTSDKNIISMLAVVYSLVQYLSAGNVADSTEDVFKYRGFQLRDVGFSSLVFIAPATLAHVVPAVLRIFNEDYYKSFNAFADDNTSSASAWWTVLVALIGTSYVAASVFVVNPLFFDNGLMMRFLLPVDMVAALGAEKNDATGETTIKYGTTAWTTTKFFLWNALKRDLLAFALRLPASYRIASFLVYLTVVVQMNLFPRETFEFPLYFDKRFRRADEAAKRSAALSNQSSSSSSEEQQQQNQQQLSSSSSSTQPPLVPADKGDFSFLANDAPLPPAVNALRMNEKERELCVQLDTDVPFWTQLFLSPVGNNFNPTASTFASDGKFARVLQRIALHDMKAQLVRARGHAGMISVSALPPNVAPHSFYGEERAAEAKKATEKKAVEILTSEYDRMSTACVFWIICGVVVSLLLSSYSAAAGAHSVTPSFASPNVLRFPAIRVFAGQTAASHAEDLRQRQRLSASFFGCEYNTPEKESSSSSKKKLNNNNMNNNNNRRPPVTVCRTALTLDAVTQQSNTQTLNVFAQQEGYNPLLTVSDAFIADREQEMQQMMQVALKQVEDEEKRAHLRESVRPGHQKQQHSSKKHNKKRDPLSAAMEMMKRDAQQRGGHGLTRAARDADALRRAGEAGGGSGAPSWFGSGPENHGFPGQSKKEFDDFMSFAQELEKRQRARGWRPKPEFAPGYNKNKKKRRNDDDDEPEQTYYEQITSGKSAEDTYSQGLNHRSKHGKKKRRNQQDEEDRQDVTNRQRGEDAGVQTLAGYHGRMFKKMSQWVETELAAGRMSLDMAGKIREQDQETLVNWMLENDESWEPDPNWKDPKKKQRKLEQQKKNKANQLRGPAAAELRRLQQQHMEEED